MTDSSTHFRFFSMAIECIGVLFFFRSLPKREEKLLRILGIASLLLLATIYFPIIPRLKSGLIFSAEGLINQTVRTGINWIVLFIFLRISKEIPRSVCWYLSGLYMLIYMVAFNMRQALQPFAFQLNPQDPELVMFAFLLFFQWGGVWVVQRTLDLSIISNVEFSRWPIIVIPVLLELYFKLALLDPSSEIGQRTFDTLFYSLCSTLGVLALVVLVERNIATQKKRNALQMEQIQLEYEIQNAKRSMQTSIDIRRLYHDMKNHLLAIDAMIGNQESAKEYVSELRSRLEEYEISVNTGNSVADALLSEKIERASLDGIRFNIRVDLTPLDFVNSVDIVTIIGNAVDNAVEALQMLSERQERIVYIKSSTYANMLVLRVSNQFVGQLTMEDGVLRTGKVDSQLHGIGLNSICKAVQRYNGSVETQFENDSGWFRLLVMLPIPSSNE